MAGDILFIVIRRTGSLGIPNKLFIPKVVGIVNKWDLVMSMNALQQYYYQMIFD